MIALYILLGLILLIALLCFVKLEFKVAYSHSFILELKVLFLTFTLLPVKKKKVKKPATPNKKIPKKKKAVEDKKKSSYIKKLSDKRGVEGLVSAVVELSQLAVTTLKKLFEKVVIEKFDVDITIVGDDAADTALKYGKICGVFYSAVSVICGTAKCDGYNINVAPDFDDEAKASVNADVHFYIRVAYVLKYALKALYKLLIIRYRR